MRHTGFQGEIAFEPNKPDGQPRRCLDVTKAKELLDFTAQMTLDEGVKRTIAWYLGQRQVRSGDIAA